MQISHEQRKYDGTQFMCVFLKNSEWGKKFEGRKRNERKHLNVRCYAIVERFFFFAISKNIQRNIYSFLNFNFMWCDFTSTYIQIHSKRAVSERGCNWLGDRSNLNRNRPFQWKKNISRIYVCLHCALLFASFDNSQNTHHINCVERQNATQ